MQDSDIIELYFLRDERAIAETDKKYGKYCYKIAFNISSDAEDAKESVNDMFLGVWNSIPPQRPVSFTAFLGKITRNIALKKQRSKNALKRGNGTDTVICELSECIPDENGVEKEIEEKELSRLIDGFLRGLPEDQRTVFIRRYWYMDQISDISLATGFSEGKIKMMLSRTRSKLRAKLTKEGVSI